jgi:hypothetical protein
LFNGLETAGNMITGGLLRPVYHESTVVLPDGVTLNTNMFSSSPIKEVRQMQAGFCYTCHNLDVEHLGDYSTQYREVPQLSGLSTSFRPDLYRPLRDYHLVDANGNQVLPATPGGAPPPGSGPSLGAAGISCDVCHNVGGADLNRSFLRDGFGNASLLLNMSDEKVGPFAFPIDPKGNFHTSSNDQSKIGFITSGAFCNTCHDVRLPGAGPGDLMHQEVNVNSPNISFLRLENLSAEWQIGAYNSANNPFGKVTTCQDCHMSLFPFGGTSSYTVKGTGTGNVNINVTSATPAVFPTNYAAVPGISTDGNYPLPQRQVVTHYFAGTDVPLLSVSELQARLGPASVDPYEAGNDQYGIPLALSARRQALLQQAARIDISTTDKTTSLGEDLIVRANVVGLSGHRFPAGFSQERTAYIHLTVKDANGFLLYQSGYLVDKPHPDTGENSPDGNLDDEDLEHIHVVVNGGKTAPVGSYTPGTATNGGLNDVFELGPDNGPDDRVFSGLDEGLVLFRNELTTIYLPGASVGRNDANGNPIVVKYPHLEETFNAALANTVDNYRSLQPLVPRQFRYEITLPTAAELAEMGVTLKGPLTVYAEINDEHFPPVFMRYIAKTTGPNGPTGHDLGLVNESTIDTYLKNLTGLATSTATVALGGAQ